MKKQKRECVYKVNKFLFFTKIFLLFFVSTLILNSKHKVKYFVPPSVFYGYGKNLFSSKCNTRPINKYYFVFVLYTFIYSLNFISFSQFFCFMLACGGGYFIIIGCSLHVLWRTKDYSIYLN